MKKNILVLFDHFANPLAQEFILEIDREVFAISREEFRGALFSPSIYDCLTVEQILMKYGKPFNFCNPKEQIVPVANPYLGELEFKNLIDAYLSGWISSQGEYVRSFENEFSKMFDAGYAVSCSNGTVALQLSLMALGIGRGDRVICPDFTFAATANAIISVGAEPVFVDSDVDNWCIDPKLIESRIDSSTKAIVVVHVFGQVCDMERINAIARRYGLYVVEDNAEGLGSKFKDKFTGTLSNIGTYSFFANKMITTGEGGMCTTKSLTIAERMREIRDHGMRPERRYWHTRLGLNLRMTNLQASIGLAQLTKFNNLVQHRLQLENDYKKQINPSSVKYAINNNSDVLPVVWFVSVLLERMSVTSLIDMAKSFNIDIRPFFKSLSTMPAFETFGSYCPVSEHISSVGVNLPTHLGVDSKVINKIANFIN